MIVLVVEHGLAPVRRTLRKRAPQYGDLWIDIVLDAIHRVDHAAGLAGLLWNPVHLRGEESNSLLRIRVFGIGSLFLQGDLSGASQPGDLPVGDGVEDGVARQQWFYPAGVVGMGMR